eukprot:363162-Chlamydomonas_euryale.AAC.4
MGCMLSVGCLVELCFRASTDKGDHLLVPSVRMPEAGQVWHATALVGPTFTSHTLASAQNKMTVTSEVTESM